MAGWAPLSVTMLSIEVVHWNSERAPIAGMLAAGIGAAGVGAGGAGIAKGQFAMLAQIEMPKAKVVHDIDKPINQPHRFAHTTVSTYVFRQRVTRGGL